MRVVNKAPAAMALLVIGASPGVGNNVTFTGSVVNACVLTVSTPGALSLATSGTLLSSEETGGVNATLNVVATGTNPTLAFGAPALTGPSASVAGSTKEIGYSSAGGANQGYTAAGSNYVMTRLLDTLTVKGRATNSSGFVTGTYAISATVTCQQ